MPKVLIENVRENREEWIKLRQGKLGGSDIPTVVGLNSFKSPLELWCEMTGKVTKEYKESRAAFYGNEVEQGIANLFQREHKSKYQVHDCNNTYIHDEYDFLICSPDRFLFPIDGNKEGLGILEIKHTAYRHPDWLLGAPDYAHVQFLYQCGFMGCEWGHISAVIEGRANDVVDPAFDHDPAIYDSLIESAVKFITHNVTKDIPPSAGAGDSQLIAKIIAEREAKTEDLTNDEEVEDMIRELDLATHYLLQHKEEFEHWETVKKKIQNQLGLRIGKKTYGKLKDGRTVTAKNICKTGFWCEPKPYLDVRISSKKQTK